MTVFVGAEQGLLPAGLVRTADHSVSALTAENQAGEGILHGDLLRTRAAGIPCNERLYAVEHLLGDPALVPAG